MSFFYFYSKQMNPPVPHSSRSVTVRLSDFSSSQFQMTDAVLFPALVVFLQTQTRLPGDSNHHLLSVSTLRISFIFNNSGHCLFVFFFLSSSTWQLKSKPWAHCLWCSKVSHPVIQNGWSDFIIAHITHSFVSYLNPEDFFLN